MIMNYSENDSQDNKIPPQYEEDEDDLTEPDYEENNRMDIIDEAEEEELDEDYTANDRGFLELPETSGSNDDYLQESALFSSNNNNQMKMRDNLFSNNLKSFFTPDKKPAMKEEVTETEEEFWTYSNTETA